MEGHLVTLQQLAISAAAVMLVALAVMRVVRVHLGRSAHPGGRARLLFLIAFLLVPPIALELVTDPTAKQGQLHGIETVLVYLAALAGLSILMGIAALFVRWLIHGRARRTLLLALVGSEGDIDDVPFAATLTPALADDVDRVDALNEVFPRGPEFAAQIDRPDFRRAWDALDAATRTLETQIDDDRRLGQPVAYRATATAADARNRLDTLRRLAAESGQAWAAA